MLLETSATFDAPHLLRTRQGETVRASGEPSSTEPAASAWDRGGEALPGPPRALPSSPAGWPASPYACALGACSARTVEPLPTEPRENGEAELGGASGGAGGKAGSGRLPPPSARMLRVAQERLASRGKAIAANTPMTAAAPSGAGARPAVAATEPRAGRADASAGNCA